MVILTLIILKSYWRIRKTKKEKREKRKKKKISKQNDESVKLRKPRPTFFCCRALFSQKLLPSGLKEERITPQESSCKYILCCHACRGEMHTSVNTGFVSQSDVSKRIGSKKKKINFEGQYIYGINAGKLNKTTKKTKRAVEYLFQHQPELQGVYGKAHCPRQALGPAVWIKAKKKRKLSKWVWDCLARKWADCTLTFLCLFRAPTRVEKAFSTFPLLLTNSVRVHPTHVRYSSLFFFLKWGRHIW